MDLKNALGPGGLEGPPGRGRTWAWWTRTHLGLVDLKNESSVGLVCQMVILVGEAVRRLRDNDGGLVELEGAQRGKWDLHERCGC